MPEHPQPYTFDRVVRLVISAAVLVGLFLLVRYLSDVLIPFALAVILAYLLNPLVNLFQRRIGRGGAVGLTLAIVALAAATAFVVVVPLALGQVTRFQRDLGKLREELAAALPTTATNTGVDASAQKTANAQSPDAAGPTAISTEPAVESPGNEASGKADLADNEEVPSSLGWNELATGWDEFRELRGKASRQDRLRLLRQRLAGTLIGQALESALPYFSSDEFRKLLVDLAGRIVSGGLTVLSFGVDVALAITGVIVVLIYLVFLLLDYPSYARDWNAFLPPDYRESIVEFVNEFSDVMSKYFRAQAVVAMIIGVLSAIGFTIINLPMAVPFGLFVGALNMVPYLGTVALVPGLMLAGLRSVENESSFLVSVLLLFAVQAVVQIVQDTVLTPLILGKATGLRPVAIMLGLFVWGKLLGFLGLLLAIPLTCLFIAYYRRIVLRQRRAPPISDA